jgi:predicted TIM-barrel fold metal-dependent hydrolase
VKVPAQSVRRLGFVSINLGQETMSISRIRMIIAAFATAIVLATMSPSAARSVERNRGPAPVVDHHLHLGSPALSDYVDQLNKLDPSIFEHLSEEVFSRPTPSDILRNLDQAGVKRGVLLSSGYLFGTLPDQAEASRKMREENRFNVETALSSNGRLIAFIAINPLAAGAMDELAYWKGKAGVSGIKLHLGAAGFRASEPQQVAILAAFFAAAREAKLPLVIHIRGGGPYSAAEVQTFIDKILSQAGDLPVQIAHGGGYAGADPATIDALTNFGKAIARRAPGTKNLMFDISGIVLPDDTAKALGSSDAQVARFVALMRKIGLRRFVIGSDWPALGAIGPYYALMRQKLPVTDAEWARLCRNEASYLH